MDLNTISSVRTATTRDDITGLGRHHAVVAGGTWLFSEHQLTKSDLVDLAGLGWDPYTISDEATASATDIGLTVSATCTIKQLSDLPAQPGWTAHPLFYQCATALLASFKIWNIATVGGNVALSLPAGSMTSLTVALDADAIIWRADGSTDRMPMRDFAHGALDNELNPGDVIRQFEFPLHALTAHTAYRKIALSPLGRSGAVIVGRLEDSGLFVLTVTASTLHPVQLRYPQPPTAERLRADVDAITVWFTDAHGVADWRRHVSGVFAEEILAELTTEDSPGESAPTPFYGTERILP